MTIKHIVLCGGGEIGFIIQGAITKLYENKTIRRNVKTNLKMHSLMIQPITGPCFVAEGQSQRLLV